MFSMSFNLIIIWPFSSRSASILFFTIPSLILVAFKIPSCFNVSFTAAPMNTGMPVVEIVDQFGQLDQFYSVSHTGD